MNIQKPVLRTVTGWWRGRVTGLGNKVGNTPQGAVFLFKQPFILYMFVKNLSIYL